MYGSLYGPDIHLTSVYYEQFHQLSWIQFCLGRISLQWSETVVAYKSSTDSTFDGLNWASSLISLLWQLTKACWNYRNQVVHGVSVEESANIQLCQLHDLITHTYQLFQEDQAYVLPNLGGQIMYVL
jgi:hypothetical protein